MARIFLIVLVLGALGLGGVVLVLGAFPPEAKVQQIQKVLPNERFQRGG